MTQPSRRSSATAARTARCSPTVSAGGGGLPQDVTRRLVDSRWITWHLAPQPIVR
ncbi:hypothetical protein [Amycolatopsis tolypomycina]|uniref:hypothetical protein n=1 Tax=Amycolatopsis tolypomycina TaxID=208445 RepID=UPI00142D8F01|nr:hypothetical protein [Amycolatopsis tolypomycina]